MVAGFRLNLLKSMKHSNHENVSIQVGPCHPYVSLTVKLDFLEKEIQALLRDGWMAYAAGSLSLCLWRWDNSESDIRMSIPGIEDYLHKEEVLNIYLPKKVVDKTKMELPKKVNLMIECEYIHFPNKDKKLESLLPKIQKVLKDHLKVELLEDELVYMDISNSLFPEQVARDPFVKKNIKWNFDTVSVAIPSKFIKSDKMEKTITLPSIGTVKRTFRTDKGIPLEELITEELKEKYQAIKRKDGALVYKDTSKGIDIYVDKNIKRLMPDPITLDIPAICLSYFRDTIDIFIPASKKEYIHDKLDDMEESIRKRLNSRWSIRVNEQGRLWIYNLWDRREFIYYIDKKKFYAFIEYGNSISVSISQIACKR